MRIRIIAALLALLMLTPALFACGKNNKEPAHWQTAEFEGFNYNNVENAWYTQIEYAKDDTVFFWDYSADVFVSFFIFGGSDAGATTLNVFDGKRPAVFLRDNLRAKERILGDFAIVDSAAYYTTYQEMSDEADDSQYLERINFYRLDRVTNKKEKIHSVDAYGLYTWMVLGDKLAYTTYEEIAYNEDDDNTFILSVRDLTKEKTIDICEKVKSYSFAGGALRYLTYEEKTFYLWEYDFDNEKSLQIGSFDGAMGTDDHLYEAALYYNFTSDKVIITGEERDYTRFYIYDIESNTLNDYNLPVDVDSCVAAEKCAYAVCVELDEKTGEYTDSEDNGLYVIDLSTGEYEKTSYKADGGTCIYVSTDGEAYIEQFDDNGDSSNRTVYRYDAKKDEATELFKK